MKPMEESPDVLVLESNHMISILFYLLEHDGCKKTDIYSGVSRGTRMPDKLDSLEASGLLITRNAGPNMISVQLTDLGRDVANSLLDIREKMIRART